MPTDLFSHKQAKTAIVKDIPRLRATAIHPSLESRGAFWPISCKLAEKLGYATCLYPVEERPDPEWVVVFLKLPTGQVSWHIPINEYMDFFPALRLSLALDDNYLNPWDGHTTVEKHRRIRQFTWPYGAEEEEV